MAQWQKQFSSISTNAAIDANECKHMKNDREYLENLMNDPLFEAKMSLKPKLRL